MDSEEEALIPDQASKKSQIKQINDFKIRVLDYIGIFLESNPINAKTPKLAVSLADAMKISVQDDNQALYNKAKTMLSELYKNKELQGNLFNDEEIIEIATQMLEKMHKSEMKKAEGYKLVLLLCLKILELQKDKEKVVIKLVKTLLTGFLTKHAKALQISFFIDYLGQHLQIGWSLLVPLLKLMFPKEKGGARTEMQQEAAIKLASHIVKRTSKTTESKVLEKALSKYDSVCKIIFDALECKEWKKPVKYWVHFLNIFTGVTGTLLKSGLKDLEKVKKIKEKIDELIAKNKEAAGLKGKAKEIEKLLKP